MNREKWFFLIVCPLALLWAAYRLVDVYEGGAPPRERTRQIEAPVVEDKADLPAAERFNRIVAGMDELPGLVTGKGRTILEPYSDLLPVEKAELALPREMPTPVVLPPVSPFPWVPYYRQFRVTELPPLAGAPTGEEGAEPPPDDAPEFEEEEEPEELDTEEVLQSKKKEFVETEWDSLTLLTGQKWYGRISLTKPGRDRGLTKYHLLLQEYRDLEFYFEKLNTNTLRVETTGKGSLQSHKIQNVEFSDTIENRYWSKRIVDRVKATDVPAMLDLGRWVRDLAEEERYVRSTGLALAAQTFKEALEAEPGDLAATLELGETLHRDFKFDEELRLYDQALEERTVTEILARKARVFRELGLFGPAESALGKALEVAPGDTHARLLRAEVRYQLGLGAELIERGDWLARALTDFQEVMDSGSPEERTAAREGKARTLLTRGDPEAAVRAFAGGEPTDEDSLVTLGCAKYARKDFAGAVEAFERALEANPDSASALTNLGIARAQAAADWDTVEQAIGNLTKARELDPLNYFLPPLGLGFAEQRLGGREERPEHLVRSVEHYITAELALPTDPYVHYVLGTSYLRDGNYEGARREFTTALRLDYRFADALLGVGSAALALGDWPAARAHLERALQVEGESVFLRYRLGRALLLSEDLADAVRYRDARAHFLKALEIDSQHVPSLNALGYIAYLTDEVEAALLRFDQARDLAPQDEKDPDRSYAEGSKERILDAQSRRLWVDDFDRPNDATKVGNGWAQTSLEAIQPRLLDGAAVVSGRHPRADAVWLTRGSPTLNGAFIAAEATVLWRPSDRVNDRFMVYQKRGGKAGEESSSTWIGIEKNTRGEVVVTSKKQTDKDETRTIVKDEDGNAIHWPEGEALLRIERSDHKKGIFRVYLNEEQVGEVDLGVRRRAGTSLYVGFRFQATAGEQHESRVLDVRVEQYVE